MQSDFSRKIKPKVSVIIVSFNMERELPRTLRSFSPLMQLNIEAKDYEIIVVDNGSTCELDEIAFRALIPNLTIYRMKDAPPSPVLAINTGLGLARGELVGVCIDGARMASPGLLSKALTASRLHSRPIIGTIAFHLGSVVQMESVRQGYNQAIEDELLATTGWEDDAYRLFSISCFAGSSRGGWFDLPAESNAIFLRAEHWRELGGYDERFVAPGGGLVNLDTWSRLCVDNDGELIMLLGEATFHQVHGGIATNNFDPPFDQFHEEYIRIRGHPYVKPSRRPMYFGGVPESLISSLKLSVENL